MPSLLWFYLNIFIVDYLLFSRKSEREGRGVIRRKIKESTYENVNYVITTNIRSCISLYLLTMSVNDILAKFFWA